MNPSDDSSRDLHNKVDTWIEKSGRALELRTARIFKTAGADIVKMSRRYEGTTTTEHREIDVFAGFTWTAAQGVTVELGVSVECKSSRDKPWVAFRDDWRFPVDVLFEGSFVFKHGPFVGLTEPFNDLWKGLPPFFPSHPMAHISTADLGGSKYGEGRNTAHDAIRQAMSGATGLHDDYLKRQGPTSKRAQLAVAVVVSAAPLFACHLSVDGRVITEQVDRLAVWEPRRDGRPTMVFVMSEQILPEFAQELAHCRDIAAEYASAKL